MSNILKEMASAFQLASLHQLTELILSCYNIPEDSKRVVLNFKVSSFYTERCGIQPVEIQLERLEIVIYRVSQIFSEIFVSPSQPKE